MDIGLRLLCCFSPKWREVLSVTEYCAPGAGVFKGVGAFDPMGVGWRKNVSSRPFIVSMGPPGYPSAWLRPPLPASVSPGKFIVAPRRSAFLNFWFARHSVAGGPGRVYSSPLRGLVAVRGI
jgi:hypothetical protein